MNEFSAIERSLAQLRRYSSDPAVQDTIEKISESQPANPEIAAQFAEILASSGEALRFEGSLTADVASTGGPSSLSTLLVPLFLRACGALVPKLGVPGRPAGGIDCLAQIPGYRPQLSKREVYEAIEQAGYAHFLASGAIAPLDGRSFRLRQGLGLQAVPTLVAASILAKKIAVGIKFAGLEVRVSPHGSFGTDWPAALKCADVFLEAAKLVDIQATAVLTDGRYPYQPYIGRRESLLALDEIFHATRVPWLTRHKELCRTLALAAVPPSARSQIAAATDDDLKRAHDQNLSAQGASLELFARLTSATLAEHRNYVLASDAGFCVYPLAAIRDTLVTWQRNVATALPEDRFPDPVGVILLQEPGTWVQKGTPLASVRVSGPSSDQVMSKLQSLFSSPSDSPVALGLEVVRA